MAQNNPCLGIVLMIATTFVFAIMDAMSRHLAGEYNVMMVMMIRYWFFAAFGIVLGITLFDETLRLSTALGAGVIVSAGIYTLWRARVNKAKALRSTP